MPHQDGQRILATLGNVAGGEWLGWVVGIDAILVLSGSVLTAYVGVTGLVRRMSLDRCLPQFLLQENPWRHTNHWIIIGFFAVCSFCRKKKKKKKKKKKEEETKEENKEEEEENKEPR